jgi:hypothetical protein
MARAVLDAYDWTDLKRTCKFLLEDGDEDLGCWSWGVDSSPSSSSPSPSSRRRKKPWRYRWPDDFRDEVLARLLELNRRRAEEETLSGPAASKTSTKRKRVSSGQKTPPDSDPQQSLFDL